MRRRWFLPGLVLLAAGCWTPQGRPATFEAESLWRPPARQEEMVAAEARPARAGQTLPGVLDLAGAVRIALETNPGIQSAFQRVEAARARVASAWSPYWPAVDARLGASRTYRVPETRQIPGLDQERTFYDVGLRGSWLLFDGLTREYRLRAARRNVVELEAAHDDARRLLELAVAGAYFDALGAAEAVRIAEADLGFERELLDETARRYRAGDRSLSDKLNFEVRVQTALANVIQTRSRLRTLRIALAELLGLEGGQLPDRVALDPVLAESVDEKFAVSDVEALVQEGLAHRPDLGGAIAAVDRAEAEVKVADGSWWPSLALTGELGSQRYDNPRFATDDAAASLALDATWNLFSGGARLAAHREALANQRVAQAQVAAIRNQVISEIRRAADDVAAARLKLVTQRERLRLTRVTRDLVRKEYDAGQTSIVRLNEAQHDFVVSEAQLVAEHVTLRIAWRRLQSALGR